MSELERDLRPMVEEIMRNTADTPTLWRGHRLYNSGGSLKEMAFELGQFDEDGDYVDELSPDEIWYEIYPHLPGEGLLGFELDSLLGPVAFMVSTGYFEFPGCDFSFVAQEFEDGEGPGILVAVKSSDKDAFTRDFPYWLVEQNPGYLHSLPAATINYQPKLITMETLYRAYWEHLETEPERWIDIRNRVLHSRIEPSHMKRALSELKRCLGEFSDSKKFTQRKIEVAAELSSLTREDRARILVDFLSWTYE